jgi:hypothetical protein
VSNSQCNQATRKICLLITALVVNPIRQNQPLVPILMCACCPTGTPTLIPTPTSSEQPLDETAQISKISQAVKRKVLRMADF